MRQVVSPLRSEFTVEKASTVLFPKKSWRCEAPG
jgi:hypothetical protein